MTHLELTRSSNDRRLYRLGGRGTLRLEGMFSNRATATAESESWQIHKTGLVWRAIEATDAAGTIIGRFEPKAVRRGGRLAWAGHRLTLEPSSVWRERYALAEDGVEVALFEGKSWGKEPVRLSLTGEGAVHAGLLLFTAFVVRSLAVSAGGTTAATSAAVNTGSFGG